MKQEPEIKFILTPGAITLDDGKMKYFCRIRKTVKDKALFSEYWLTWRQVDFPLALLGDDGSLKSMEKEIFNVLKTEYAKNGLDNMAVEIH